MTAKWEIFLDIATFHLWAVRPIGDRDYNSPNLKWFKTKQEAESYKESVELLNE